MIVRWVTIRKFSEITGYTEDAVRAKIQRGDWPMNYLWTHAPDHRVLMNLEQYEKWVEGKLDLQPHLRKKKQRDGALAKTNCYRSS